MDVITLNIRRILVLLVFLLSISCKSQIQDSIKNEYSLSVNEIKLGKHISELLKATKVRFNDRFKKQPQVIIIEFFIIHDTLIMTVENRSTLYSDIEEHQILGDDFIGGTMLDNSFVLLKKQKTLDINFISIKPNLVTFNLLYNNNTDFWKGKYKFTKNDIVLIDEYWSYEIFTD